MSADHQEHHMIRRYAAISAATLTLYYAFIGVAHLVLALGLYAGAPA